MKKDTNPPEHTPAYRIQRIKLIYCENYEDQSTCAKLQAHAIITQIIDYCERGLQRGWHPNKGLLKKINMENLYAAYLTAQTIYVTFSKTLDLRFACPQTGDKDLYVTFEIEPWGHIKKVSQQR